MGVAPTKTRALAAAATVATTLVWLALAWRTPTSTFHFAPIVALGIGPWIVKSQAGRQQPVSAVATVGISLAIVGIAIAVLTTQDRMLGPTFWSESGATGEAILFSLGTAALSFAWLIAGTRESE